MTCLYLMDNLHSTLHWKQWSYGPQFRSYATLHFVCGFVAEADGAQWTGPAACRRGAQGGAGWHFIPSASGRLAQKKVSASQIFKL